MFRRVHKDLNKKWGFTLLELLISMAMIVVSGGVVATTMKSYNAGKTFTKAETRKVHTRSLVLKGLLADGKYMQSTTIGTGSSFDIHQTLSNGVDRTINYANSCINISSNSRLATKSTEINDAISTLCPKTSCGSNTIPALVRTANSASKIYSRAKGGKYRGFLSVALCDAEKRIVDGKDVTFVSMAAIVMSEKPQVQIYGATLNSHQSAVDPSSIQLLGDLK